MAWSVTCPCGYTISVQTQDEFVRMVQKHGIEVHKQSVTREEALALGKRRRPAQRAPQAQGEAGEGS